MAKLKGNKKIYELKNKNIGSTMFLIVASNRSKYTERIYEAIAVYNSNVNAGKKDYL